MAQPLLHHRQHQVIAAGFCKDHPVGMQPAPGQRRAIEIAPTQAPQHRPFQPRQHARDEQRRHRGSSEVGCRADHLMQRPQRQPAPRQAAVEREEAERQHPATPPAAALDGANARPQFLDDAPIPHVRPSSPPFTDVPIMFLRALESINRAESTTPAESVELDPRPA